MLKYENVTFLKEPAKRLTKEEFIALHLNVFWLDRDEATRKKILGQVYDLITKPAKRTKQKAE